MLLINQSSLKLTAGMGLGNFIGPNGVAPPITPGSHDNVDAFDMAPLDLNGDLITDKQAYGSINPAQRIINGGGSESDIYRIPSGSVTPIIFASASTMGLVPTFDNIDGLEVFDRGVVGVLEPGLDYALFSLAPVHKAFNLSWD